MAYTQQKRDEVISLRMKGMSLGEIKVMTGIPLTTIYDWTNKISLTDEQRKIIRDRIQTALQKGRLQAQTENKKKYLKRQKYYNDIGKQQVGKLSKRDLFIAGVALYWAEGFKNKYEHRLGFCNSDPAMIKFYLLWLKNCLRVNNKDIVLRVTLNEKYRDKTDEIQHYWAKTLKLPITQFTKPFYQKSIWKREYNTESYRGVLRVHVKNSLDQLSIMQGYLGGMKDNLPA